MRRALPLIVLALLPAGPAAAAAPQRPPLEAVLETCLNGLAPAQRVAAFRASMPARAGAKRMAMRFELQRRVPGTRGWRPLQGAPGFGVWERSLPRRAGFVFHKRVDRLSVPAAYRAVVRFRWLAADGTVVARTRRRTRPCRQPDLRPDLVPGVLSAADAATPGRALYSLEVRNAGRSAAGSFLVRVGSAAVQVPGLAAGQRRDVQLTGPACRQGASVLAEVDAGGRVDESLEQNNAARWLCPIVGTAPRGGPARVDTLDRP
jgi:hypothetical protein